MVVGKVSEFIGSLYYLCVTLLRFKNIMKLKNYLLLLALLLAVGVTQAEMDRTYSYPYMRTYHPSYEETGGVPAIREVKFSLISNRGCFGGCNFCALTFHQGRIIQTRSHESLVNEAKKMICALLHADCYWVNRGIVYAEK